MDNNTQNTQPNREPVTKNSETVNTHTENLGARNIVGALFGLIEILISFRFVLKLFGANSSNSFVQFMYSVTGFFVNLFQGIFPKAIMGEGDSGAVFEPASIIALIVVAFIAWFVFKLMTPKKDKSTTDKTSYTSNTGNDTKQQ